MEPDGLFNLSRGDEALPSFGGRAGPAVEGLRLTLGRQSDATGTPFWADAEPVRPAAQRGGSDPE